MKNEQQRDEAEIRARAAFEELRADDQAHAPPFSSLWGRPAAARPTVLFWLVPLGAAAAAVLLVLAVAIDTARPLPPTSPPAVTDADPELVGIPEPEPLAFLLGRPRGEEP